MAQNLDEEKKEYIDNQNDTTEIHELLKSISNENLLNNAKGLCLGAAIGDSIGSFCEFSTEPISDEQMKNAMKMPGGGPHGINPGQITDDTELAICLARGLINICNKNKNHIFDSHLIAIEYKNWLNSQPFDVGACTGNTLYYGPNVIKMKHAANNYNYECQIKYKNEGNLSNGSLMRCQPLILYGYKLSNDNIYKIMSQDSCLSHANDIIYIINTMYAIGTRYLLLTTNKTHKHRNIKCIDLMISYLRTIMATNKNGADAMKQKAAKVVMDWYNEMEKENKFHDATKQIAFIKIAVQRIFYHLKNITSFEKVIYDVVKEGGDSDTNACIVGGILGCYFGYDCIPKQYVEKILNCDAKQNEYVNDRKIFQAKHYMLENMIEILIKYAPNDMDFKMKEYDVYNDNDNDLDKIEYITCKQCGFIRYKSDGAEDENDNIWYCLQCWQTYDS